VTCGAAQRAHAHSPHAPRIDTNHAAVGKLLCLRLASKSPALEQNDRQSGIAQIHREDHARSSAARNADVGLECGLFQRIRI
jgi:hypothetical protein